MNNVLLYLLQSSLSLVLLYTLYMLVLRNKSHFLFNRIYLLLSVISSLCIPLIDFSVFTPTALYVVQLNPVTIGAEKSVEMIENTISATQIVGLVYVGVSFLLLLKLTWEIWSVFNIKRQSRLSDKSGITQSVFINSYQNFSFFNWVFIREEDQNNSSILDHEKAHSQMLHSFDIMMIKLLQLVYWFNPLVFFIERELRLQHEYQVDKKVLNQHNSIVDYQQLLLNQVFHTEFSLITNNFNQTFLKNRFIMMTKKENRSPFLLAALFLMAVVTPVLFSCSMETAKEEVIDIPIEEKSVESVPTEVAPIEKAVEEKNTEDAETNQKFLVVEDMPMFPGGEQALIEFIGKNINYPEEAKMAEISGRVFVEFVVEKDGSISEVGVMRGIGYGCDKEAVRVIESMPKWKPGSQRGKNVRVEYRMPINFKLK